MQKFQNDLKNGLDIKMKYKMSIYVSRDYISKNYMSVYVLKDIH